MTEYNSKPLWNVPRGTLITMQNTTIDRPIDLDSNNTLPSGVQSSVYPECQPDFNTWIREIHVTVYESTRSNGKV
jgi:hypothetical protein